MISKWKVDPEHSELFFKVKFLKISEVSGYFTSFDIDAKTEGHDFGEITDLIFTTDINAICSNNKQRDTLLKSSDFFDVENHQHLTFTATKFEKQGMEPQTFMTVFRRDYKLYGNLTIKGITRPIILNGEFGGTAVDNQGQKRAGFTVRGTINRKNFSLGIDGMTEVEKLLWSDDVNIQGNIQLIKQF